MQSSYIIKKGAALLIICMAGTYAGASLYTTGAVDWRKGIIEAQSISSVYLKKGIPLERDNETRISLNSARINAYDRAREKAVAKIVGSVLSIRVDSDNVMRDILNKYDISRSRLSDVITEKILFTDYPAGHLKSACRAKLALGDLIDVIPYEYPSLEFPGRMDNPIKTYYSSVIIDTRGLGIDPMIFPSIYNVHGLEVYSKNYIDVKYATRFGIVSYAYNEDEALGNRRSGDHPYFAAAVKSMKNCPVLAEKDVRKIFSSDETLRELKKCRVIFIIDREDKSR